MSIDAQRLIVENKLLTEVIELKKELTSAKVKASVNASNKVKAQRQRDLVRMQLTAARREIYDKGLVIKRLEKEIKGLKRDLFRASVSKSSARARHQPLHDAQPSQG